MAEGRRARVVHALALAAMTTAALSLVACATYAPREERPPFATIGPWTGATWSGSAPTLGTTLDPRSSNPCASGVPRCMDAVVGEMSARLRPLAARCDHLAPFALMYLNVSTRGARRRARGALPLTRLRRTSRRHVRDALLPCDRRLAHRPARSGSAGVAHRLLGGGGQARQRARRHAARDERAHQPRPAICAGGGGIATSRMEPMRPRNRGDRR